MNKPETPSPLNQIAAVCVEDVRTGLQGLPRRLFSSGHMRKQTEYGDGNKNCAEGLNSVISESYYSGCEPILVHAPHKRYLDGCAYPISVALTLWLVIGWIVWEVTR